VSEFSGDYNSASTTTAVLRRTFPAVTGDDSSLMAALAVANEFGSNAALVVCSSTRMGERLVRAGLAQKVVLAHMEGGYDQEESSSMSENADMRGVVGALLETPRLRLLRSSLGKTALLHLSLWSPPSTPPPSIGL
jgi:hypothetical protein